MKVIETRKPQPKQMVGGVIVSHGHLASELITTAEMIAGPMPHVTPAAIDWHDDVDVAHAELERAIARASNGRGVLLLTDMFGGAPTDVASMFLSDPAIEVISGVNLPLISKIKEHSGEAMLVATRPRIRAAGK